MASLTLALVLAVAIVFSRDAGKWIGFIAAVLLVMAFPRFFLALLLLVAGGAYLFNHFRRNQ